MRRWVRASEARSLACSVVAPRLSRLRARLSNDMVRSDPIDFMDPLSLSPSRRTAILAALWLSTFLASLNTTLVATLITSISAEFNHADMASWIGTSYLLSTATFTPLYGRIAAISRRSAHQIAILFLFLGTLGCAASPSIQLLILARFVAGIGGGGIFTTASIVTSDMYSMRNRSLTQGYASLFSGFGMGLGGPLGGAMAVSLGWRWAFISYVSPPPLRC